MSATHRTATKHKISRALRARKLARENASVVILLAIVVAAAVTGLLTRRVLAAKHQVRVLDCPVVGAVAHHHDDNCFDEEGNLVCFLPERDMHAHDESCYERQLVCGKAEGEGAHYHDDACYDEWGNLACGQEETEGHQHDDSCYADVLVCGQEECAREHVHGDGCWKVVAANEDAVEATRPEQAFQHDVRDRDKRLQLRINAEAPLGALPAGSTMDVKLIDADKVDVGLVQKALDKAAEQRMSQEGGEDAPEMGKVLKWQAVDVTFRDAGGNEVQPAKDVTVTLTSKLAKTADARSVVRVEDEEEAARRAAEAAHAAAGSQAQDDGALQAVVEGEPSEAGKPAIEAQAVDQLSESALKERDLELRAGQVAFDADRSTTYVLATTSLAHEMRATDGSTVSVTVEAPAGAGIPQGAVLDVVKVNPDDEAYDGYVGRTVESMGAERSDVALASFFDIKIRDAEGNEVHPQAPVDVKMELTDIPDAPSGFAAVHFKESGEEGTELERLACGGEGGTVTFAADSFSVYGIVYTVDFGYEVDGELYQWTLPGGGSVGLRELVEALHVHEGGPRAYEDAAAFMDEVQNVTFSDPGLVWLQPVPAGEPRTLAEMLDEQGLTPEYASGVTEEQRAEWLAASYENDWALISLKPFTTTEMLTITMTDGSQRLIAVTDAQDAPMSSAGPLRASGGVPDTIPNPAGTTIDLFDYWVDDSLKDRTAREAWPDFVENGDGNHTYNGITIRGSGNEGGINQGHVFKFNPAYERTVLDGPWDGNSHQLTSHNDNNNQRMNAWTKSADPRLGLVRPTLDEDGYPQLTGDYDQYSDMGTNGESLAYLFDESDYLGGTDADHDYANQIGKERFEGADHLLYVDDEGYYVFDSYQYYATFDRDDKTFSLEDQNGRTGDSRGFWPFGDQRYWAGVHMKTQFSMPKDGQVLSPKGTYNDMTFEFQGDDDTWIYIDGVLVGDGGGIHNRTDIKINYATGEVTVSGKKDENHQGSYEQTTTLKQLFIDAGKDQDYIDAHFNGNTFKDNSYHTFDMFYLERGGGESNIFIRYNLVSTADFTSHKDYQGATDDDILSRDQFHFELVGLEGEYTYSETRDQDGNITSFTLAPGTEPGDDTKPAVMPKHDKADGSYPGTMMHPYYSENETFKLSDGTQVPAQLYATGVTEDGNVNFGTADITEAMREAYALGKRPAYKYVIREVIPPDAVNELGKRYEDCTEQERLMSPWFTKDNLMYDAIPHYMVATVTSWEEDGVVHYGLSKRYFVDDTFSQLNNEGFINFDNRYVSPLTLDVIKEEKADHSHKLPGAEFTLSSVYLDLDTGEVVVPAGGYNETKTTGSSGEISFEDLHAGLYYLEETKAPLGYKRLSYKWLISIGRRDMAELTDGQVVQDTGGIDPALIKRKYSELVPSMQKVKRDGSDIEGEYLTDVDLDNLIFTQEVENEPAPPFEFAVEKHWGGIDLSDPDDAAAVANSQVVVTLGRYKLADIAGTLTIVKQGVPAGARMTATYTVRDDGGNVYATLTNGTWSGQNHSFDPISLPPGDYTVEETIDPDDERYTTSHPESGAANAMDVAIVDEGSETATFTSTYTPKKGSLTITSALDNQTSPVETIDTSQVKYQLYDEDDGLVGTYFLDSDFTYNQAAGRYEYTVNDLLVGEYRVVESGWPEDIANVRCTHTNGTAKTGTVTEDATPSYDFVTTYTTGNPVRVIVYRANSGEGSGIPSGDDRRIYDDVVTSSSITLNFTAKSNGNPVVGTHTNDNSIATTDQIQWGSGSGDNLRPASVDIDIPSGYDDGLNPFVIVITTGWGATDAIGDSATITENAPTFGSLTVSASLTDSRSDTSTSVDTSGVVYKVMSGSTEVASCTYAQASAAGGHTFDSLPTGSYTVVTEGWPELQGAQLVHAYDPQGGAVSVTDGGTATCSVATTAKDPSAAVAVRLYFRQGSYASYNLVTEKEVATNQVVLRIQGGGVYGAPLEFADADGNSLTSTKSGNNDNVVEYVFDVPSGASGFDIYASCSWWGSMPENTTLSAYPAAGTNSAPAQGRGLLAAPRLSRGTSGIRALRGGIQPGTDTQDSSDSGDRPTPAEANKKYVVDESFTTGNVVTLTAADLDSGVWRERVTSLPADDGNGSKYFYFIQSVSETGLPAGTELTIVKDGTDKMLAFENDDYDEPNHLVARNTVGLTADVSLLKVDADDGTNLDGAAFHLVKVEGQSETAVTSPTVSPLSSGQSVIIDANGVFNVPSGGALIESLQPGTYKVVEDTPPDGYVMTDTIEFEITVNADGTVTETSGGVPVSTPQYLSGSTLTVPNVAGEALPHSGGAGTVAGTMAGIALVAFGCLMYLRTRRA